MKGETVVISVIAATVAGALGFGLYNYLAAKKLLPPPVTPIISTTAVSTTQIPPVKVYPPPPSTTSVPTGAQSLTRNWSLDFSRCECVQGYGGSLTYNECQSGMQPCRNLHTAQLIHIQ